MNRYKFIQPKAKKPKPKPKAKAKPKKKRVKKKVQPTRNHILDRLSAIEEDEIFWRDLEPDTRRWRAN